MHAHDAHAGHPHPPHACHVDTYNGHTRRAPRMPTTIARRDTQYVATSTATHHPAQRLYTSNDPGPRGRRRPTRTTTADNDDGQRSPQPATMMASEDRSSRGD
jgi:hypothetical protein